MSDTGIKDLILEQKMLPVFLSLRNLQEFQQLCVRKQGQRPIYVLFIINHNIKAALHLSPLDTLALCSVTELTCNPEEKGRETLKCLRESSHHPAKCRREINSVKGKQRKLHVLLKGVACHCSVLMDKPQKWKPVLLVEVFLFPACTRIPWEYRLRGQWGISQLHSELLKDNFGLEFEGNKNVILKQSGWKFVFVQVQQLYSKCLKVVISLLRSLPWPSSHSK